MIERELEEIKELLSSIDESLKVLVGLHSLKLKDTKDVQSVQGKGQ